MLCALLARLHLDFWGKPSLSDAILSWVWSWPETCWSKLCINGLCNLRPPVVLGWSRVMGMGLAPLFGGHCPYHVTLIGHIYISVAFCSISTALFGCFWTCGDRWAVLCRWSMEYYTPILCPALNSAEFNWPWILLNFTEKMCETLYWNQRLIGGEWTVTLRRTGWRVAICWIYSIPCSFPTCEIGNVRWRVSEVYLRLRIRINTYMFFTFASVCMWVWCCYSGGCTCRRAAADSFYYLLDW